MSSDSSLTVDSIPKAEMCLILCIQDLQSTKTQDSHRQCKSGKRWQGPDFKKARSWPQGLTHVTWLAGFEPRHIASVLPSLGRLKGAPTSIYNVGEIPHPNTIVPMPVPVSPVVALRASTREGDASAAVACFRRLATAARYVRLSSYLPINLLGRYHAA